LYYFFLVIGDRVLTQTERNNERRMQQTYQQLMDAEQKRMENEYRQKSEELTRKWKKQLDEEKIKLQKVICFFFNL